MKSGVERTFPGQGQLPAAARRIGLRRISPSGPSVAAHAVRARHTHRGRRGSWKHPTFPTQGCRATQEMAFDPHNRRPEPGTGMLDHCDIWTQSWMSSCPPPLQPPSLKRQQAGWGAADCMDHRLWRTGGLPEDPSRPFWRHGDGLSHQGGTALWCSLGLGRHLSMDNRDFKPQSLRNNSN